MIIMLPGEEAIYPHDDKATDVIFRDQDLLGEHRDASFAASSGIALQDWLHNLAARVVMGNIIKAELNFNDVNDSMEEDEEETMDEWYAEEDDGDDETVDSWDDEEDEDDNDGDDDEVTAHFFGADGIANAPGWATLGGF